MSNGSATAPPSQGGGTPDDQPVGGIFVSIQGKAGSLADLPAVEAVLTRRLGEAVEWRHILRVDNPADRAKLADILAGGDAEIRCEWRPQQAAAPANQTATSWIEIKLIDEDGSPVPNEAYRVKQPSGTVVEGNLNQDGFARIEGIDPPGTCQVTFPGRDQDAWATYG